MYKHQKYYLLLVLVLVHVLLFVAYNSNSFNNINISTIPFSKVFSPLFGESNIFPSQDHHSVQLHLNQYTGSGFKSSDLYNYGFFSAKIKLPSDYTAGIVVAFYTINGDIFRKCHDELDFELLGNVRRKEWRFHTNMYGNGSTNRGREERYYLWFDPSKHFHRYTILWSTNNIIFYIDDVPIREIVRNDAMGSDFPEKPMALYATIWDASDWATSGGKYRANYKYAPFVVEFTNLVLHGCPTDLLEEVVPSKCADRNDRRLASITSIQRSAMKKFRTKYMYYSYCYDTVRYSVPPPECIIDPVERQRFNDIGRLKFDEKRRRRMIKKRGKVMEAGNYRN